MARLFTAEQARQNRRFLTELARNGNVRLAARTAGIAYSTMQDRRARHPVLATRWDAAPVAARARLQRKGPHRPEARLPGDRARRAATEHRTQGGEPVIIPLKNGKLQMRAAQPGKLTRAAEQRSCWRWRRHATSRCRRRRRARRRPLSIAAAAAIRALPANGKRRWARAMSGWRRR